MCPVAIAALLQIASANPKLDETVEYYEVYGSNARQVRAAIDRLRPRNTGGKQHDALTSWYVRWKYQYVRGERTCTIAAVDTAVEIRTTLPRWADRPPAGFLAEQWDRYLDRLTKHQQGHRQIAVQAAEAIQKGLLALEPASTCEALAASVQLKASGLVDAYGEEEVEYDKRTKATRGGAPR
jgi:predicted secreted Zn-dependent protease